MRALRALLAVLGLTLLGTVFAQPSFPTLTGRVVDAAGVLNDETEQALTQQLADHEAKTSNQIVVATVPSLEGFDVSDYGLQLAQHWEIGTAEKNNGVLLLVAPNERKVRIDVGFGLEGALPDAMAGQIIRKRILPAFRENDYAAGVTQGVKSITDAIAGEYEFDPNDNAGKSSNDVHLQAAVPLLFIAIMGVSQLARRKFNSRRVSQAVVPAGFTGMVGLIASGNAFVALAIAVGVFALIFLTSRTRGTSPNPSTHRHHGGMGGGFGGGGGFSGGGGGFGGGGASGGW